MGQRWQPALKHRMIMIPLPEIKATGAASGVCCSGKGCCRASGSQPDGPTYSDHTEVEELKNHCGVKCCANIWSVALYDVWGITIGGVKTKLQVLNNLIRFYKHRRKMSYCSQP